MARLIIELDIEATGETLQARQAVEAIDTSLPFGYGVPLKVGESGSIDLHGETVGTWEVAP